MASKSPAAGQAPDTQPTLSEVAALVGGTDAAKHMAVLRTGATAAEIRTAVAYRAAEQDELGEVPPALEGRTALVYDVLIEHEGDFDDEL
jgi:hypothetical protein